MFGIAWKETRTNALFLLFTCLGVSVLLGIVFALFSFTEQMPDSYLARFEDVEYVSFESDSREVLNLGIDNLFLYGKCAGVTYHVTLSCGEKEVEIPEYNSGVCVYSVNDRMPVLQYVTDGEPFSESGEDIWLAKELREELGCEVGAQITLRGKNYTLKGIYDIQTRYYSNDVPFFIFEGTGNTADFESAVAVISDKKQLTELVKADGGRLFDDKYGILELSRGYNLLCYGMNGILLFLIVLMTLFFVSMIRMYLMRRLEFFRILHRCGISAGKLGGYLFAMFAALSVIASALATLWDALFYSLIDRWAKDFLHIRLDSQAYLVLFLCGAGMCTAIVGIGLLLLLRRRTFRWEVANR